MSKPRVLTIFVNLIIIGLIIGGVLSFKDCHQLDIRSGQTRWVKMVYGIPLLTYSEESEFSKKLQKYGLCDDHSQPCWVTDARLSIFHFTPIESFAPDTAAFIIGDPTLPFYGIIWHCNTVCQLMDQHCISDRNQYYFFQYLLIWMEDHRLNTFTSYPTRELITLSGGPIEVQSTVSAIPIDATQGNLIECYIETQFAPLVIPYREVVFEDRSLN